MPLIVLEGLDGAGKSTQLEFLRKMVDDTGSKTEFLHFPRFDTPLYGEMITRFLKGDFGTHDQVDPYTVALMYAGDRFEAKPLLQGWLDEGRFVFLDRYVYSNVAYQCAKVSDRNSRKRLKEWILHLEYDIYGIPRPDVSLFLDVPFEFTCQRLTSKREGRDRDYLQGGEDVHEASLELQKNVRQVYLDAAAEDPQFKIVDCGDADGRMLLPAEIFEKIVSNLRNIIE